MQVIDIVCHLNPLEYKENNMRPILYLLLLFSSALYAQSGASTHSDAIHAFDESHSGSGGFGVLGFIVMLILFIVGIVIWGYNMKNDK